ncbi:MAG: diaminopimelate decarboxylase [Pseudomonadota bacterium]
MHHFCYRNGDLYCEDVPLRAIAEAVGTPTYVYSQATLERHYRAFAGAFDEELPHLVCYSVKANSNASVLGVFFRLGAGADVVSGGELFRALRAGCDPAKIVFSGVGKQEGEIEYALRSGILALNVESHQELLEVDRVAGLLGKKAPVSLRINPDVDPQTHPYLATGLEKSKFGIPMTAALAEYETAQSLANIDVCGIDCHIGSQLTQTSPFRDAIARIAELARELGRRGIPLRLLDIGGGLGIRYREDSEEPPAPAEYARAIVEAVSPFDGLGLRLICEPGRVLVGNAGILLTKVLYLKEGQSKRFTIVDAGFNDLARPTLYGSFHEILPARRKGAPEPWLSDVVGPICESGDFLAKDREMAKPAQGDLLAVMSAGAYGFAMASTYNSRPRAAEVLVKGDRFAVVRTRESYEDLVRGEKPV